MNELMNVWIIQQITELNPGMNAGINKLRHEAKPLAVLNAADFLH